jgi:hypothetical protein
MSEKRYIAGMFRGDNGKEIVSHLYYGEYSGPLTPMCSGGWQRKYFDETGKLVDWEFSIFRGNISEKGLCKICERRAEKNLPPIDIPKAKYNPKNPNHYQSASYSHNEGQDVSDVK